MNEMRVEKWWNEICGRGKRETPREKPTQTPLRPPRNPRGMTETQTQDPSGGRRASNRLRHGVALSLNITRVGFFVLIFLLFRHKISEFRINCFKFTQYFAKILRLIFIIIHESSVTYARVEKV